ncbi:MAG: hypothetical protein QM754_08000 [Tepidisphaeraceae bacterium]
MARRPELTPKQQAALQNLFDDLPGDYKTATAQLGAISYAFRSELAAAFEPRLNDVVQAKHERAASQVDHRMLAEDIDIDLRNFGLCLSHQGKPALLVTTSSLSAASAGKAGYTMLIPGKWPAEERLHFTSPPKLSLMAAPNGVDVLLDPLRKRVERSWRGR